MGVEEQCHAALVAMRLFGAAIVSDCRTPALDIQLHLPRRYSHPFRAAEQSSLWPCCSGLGVNVDARSLAIHQLARLRPNRRVIPHAQVKPQEQGPVRMAPTTYIICTNPRSGSWLLSEGLASTSLAGNPREWFNIMEEQRYRARWRIEESTDLSYEAYLRHARVDSTTRNGISGVKLHYYQFAELPTKMEAVRGLRGMAGLWCKLARRTQSR
jgi:hypothetical protein